MKEVHCTCGWIGTLDEAWEAATTEVIEGDTDDPFDYDEWNVFLCPKCHKEGLEVFEDGKRLGGMGSYG